MERATTKLKQLNSLTLIRYYGGKSKMAYLLGDMLNYSDTDTYAELFGGGARVLLSKPRHDRELYFDVSICVYSLFKVVSDRDLTEQLIMKLCAMGADEDTFNECKVKFDFVEGNFCEDLISLINKRTKKLSSHTRDRINNGQLVDIHRLFNWSLNYCCMGKCFVEDGYFELTDEIFLESLLKKRVGSKVIEVMEREETLFRRKLEYPNFAEDAEGIRIEEELDRVDIICNDDYISVLVEEIKDLLNNLNSLLNESNWNEYYRNWVNEISLTDQRKLRTDEAKKEALFWRERYAEIHKISSEELDKGKFYYEAFINWRSQYADDNELEIDSVITYDVCARNGMISEEKFKQAKASVECVFINCDYDYSTYKKYRKDMFIWKKDFAESNNISIDEFDEFFRLHKVYKDKEMLLMYDKAREVFYGNKYGYWNYQFDKSLDDIDILDMATWAYIVYNQSMNSAGQAWSKDKFRTVEHFHRQIDNIYDVHERMKDVVCLYGDSIEYLRSHKDQPNICFFLDPPYLQSQEKVTDGKLKRLTEYNPGHLYKDGWSRAKHETLLRLIVDAKAKIVLCGYTDKYGLYDSYLNKGTGWQKLEYETVTTVSSTKDNYRTECIWCNY